MNVDVSARWTLAADMSRWLAEQADRPLGPGGIPERLGEAVAVFVEPAPWVHRCLTSAAAEELVDLILRDENGPTNFECALIAELMAHDTMPIDQHPLCRDEAHLAAYRMLHRWLRAMPGGPATTVRDLHCFDLERELAEAGWWP
jgi:hypothetical protein